MESSSEIEVLYRRHVGAARAFAVAITGDAGLAEDIVQDAFIRTAASLSRLRDPERFRAYLFRTVTRVAVSDFRRRAAERRSLGRLAGQAGRSAVEVAPSGLAEDLLAALVALPPRQRAAVAARFLLDWSEAETARAIGCRVGTVKSLTSRGLAALRSSMADEENLDHA